MQTKRLEMIFQNSAGNRITVSVLDPKDDLTAQSVEAAMGQILALNAITTAGGDLTAILGARIVTRDVNDILVV
ncbi:MAG: DUF2922 domain-containing protein [Bacillota bacterium]|uniref:DUF2922 family protein n=1 Tax=Thermanaerosceptrum fracticalcis TaxID=1712410 RepID=A0A7G6DZ42_THEFR|nr:DUF2922 domain-containing protein [Thermanaerosceptrum fracticalcis]QNB45096.1 DUF2922 family protein [Thermanaerosceptrum fracticalcis]